MLGIMASFVRLAPFDRLSGGFDNDRIVLYTYLMIKADTTLFARLVEQENCILLSFLNDLPGFGNQFIDD